MTKFDIFVVNLGRSADRREAMKRKIAKIRGFKAIYIDGEKVLDSAESQNLNQNNSVRSTQTRPLRGAKNRIQGCSSATADFLLEAEKRGSPPKSEKRQLLARRGSGAGGAALLRKESSKNNGEGVAESSLDSIKSQNLQGGLPRRFCESVRNDDIFLVSTQSAESTLHFHFFPATDATKFKNGESPLPPQYSSKLTRFVKGKDLSFGEIACFSSHYRLWQKCVELDSPIIVLEDDIDFMQDFCQIIEIFKSPFEYVRLYYLFDRKITHLYDNFYISFGNVSGAQGYYLTPQVAQKFIKNTRFWLFCVDDYMDMFFIHSVKNIIFKPFIISEDSLSAENSTILGREKPKMRFYQKLTRELSRIYFFVIRKYVYFALHCVELRVFFRANRR